MHRCRAMQDVVALNIRTYNMTTSTENTRMYADQHDSTGAEQSHSHNSPQYIDIPSENTHMYSTQTSMTALVQNSHIIIVDVGPCRT